jgi:tryptophan-rich sensory protein
MSQRSTLSQTVGLAAWLAVVFAAAAIGALASIDAGAFYAQLVRPAWGPRPHLVLSGRFSIC